MSTTTGCAAGKPLPVLLCGSENPGELVRRRIDSALREKVPGGAGLAQSAAAPAAPGAGNFPPVAVKACQNDPGKRDAELDKKTDTYQAIDQGEPNRVKIQRPAHAAQFCPCWSRRHSAVLLVWVRPHPGLFPAVVDAAPRCCQDAERLHNLPDSVQGPLRLRHKRSLPEFFASYRALSVRFIKPSRSSSAPLNRAAPRLMVQRIS